MLFIDELSPYFRKGGAAPDAINKLVRFGRRQDVSTLLITQRATDCPIEVRSQLTDLFIFRLIEADLEHISRFIGKRNVDLIVDLPFYSYVHFDLTAPHSGDEWRRNQNGLEARTLGDGHQRRNLLGRQSDSLDSRQRYEAAGHVADDQDEQEQDE